MYLTFVVLIFTGHAESYNPPPEYLPTEEEVRNMSSKRVMVEKSFIKAQVVLTVTAYNPDPVVQSLIKLIVG